MKTHTCAAGQITRILFLVLSLASVSLGQSSGSASFLTSDTSTQGNWKGVYGTDGSALAGVTPQNIPSYATLRVHNQGNYTWAADPTDPRALETGTGTATIAACWYTQSSESFTFDLNFTDGHTHQLALYAVDWDKIGRADRIQIVDDSTGHQLDLRTLSNFTSGIYLVWNISGHVRINITSTGETNAVVSGVFLGPVRTAAVPNLLTSGTSAAGNAKAEYVPDETGPDKVLPQLIPSHARLRAHLATSIPTTLPLSIILSPSEVALARNQTQAFSVGVQNSTNQSVTWSLSPNLGTISAAGVYTAPTTIATAQNVTVTATTVATPSQSASATITLTASTATRSATTTLPLSVAVSPSGVSLAQNQTQAFSASVQNSTNQSVTWSLSPNVGTISAAGVYTAPTTIATAQNVTVTATTVATPSQSASATITLTASTATRSATTTLPLSVAVSPSGVSLAQNQTQAFSASVQNSTNQSVTWSLSPNLGTISAAGIYTAPTTIATAQNVAVTATTVATPSQSASATITLTASTATRSATTTLPLSVAVSPSGVSLAQNQTQAFSASVQNSTNQSVTWSLSPNVGTISAAGVYTAPTTIATAQNVTVTATTVATPSQSASATIALTASTAPVTSSTTGSTTTSWNPASLGVAWASDFSSIAANQINVKSDSRLTVKAAGDGATDDTSAISAAIQLASSSGGGVVYFPTGNYKIATPSNATTGSPLMVPSRVILRGDSSTASLISLYDSNAASETGGFWTWGGISFSGSSLSGMTDLGVSFINPSTSPCATIWNLGSSGVSELFFNNLNVQMGNNRTFWFNNVNELLVQGSSLSTGDAQNQQTSQAGAVYLTGNSNVSFLNNTISYSFGRMHMENNTNVLIQGNTITRNAENNDMDNGTAIESGGMELSFDQNVQVLNNTIETLNAPANELGDGEAIMAQNTGTGIQDQGSATSITSATLTDTSALWGSTTSSAVASGVVIVAMISGSGTGEWRTVTGINTTTKTLTVSPAFNPVPSTGDLYSLTEWPIENATIKGNNLTGNPNGIIIYDGCYNCAIENNTLTDSRDILLRVDSVNSSYGESRGVHEVAITNSILNNTVTNMSGIRPSFIALDTEAFASAGYSGMGEYDIQVGGNTVNPYSTNPNQSYNNPPTEISQDGLFPCFLYGPAPNQAPATTVFQNINFWGNSKSVSVTYAAGFSHFTNQTCVTPSAPSN